MTYSYAQMAAVASAGLVKHIRDAQAALESYTGNDARIVPFVEMTSLYFTNTCALLTDETRQLSNEELMLRLMHLDQLTEKVKRIKTLATHPETSSRIISEIRFDFDLLLSSSMGIAGVPVVTE